MIVVDGHCHASLVWYEPVESLLDQMERNDVRHAVLIQMQGEFDNTYQFDCVRRYPGRFAPVVLVDVASADAPETLARLAGEGASGVRLSATARSLGDDPLAIWRQAARLGLSISCAGSATDFASPEFAALVESVPKVRIVLEHLGSLSRPDRDDAERAARIKAFELARFPNVLIKATGLGEFCRRAIPIAEPEPFAQPEPPHLREALDAFGPRRLIWGSDFPPVSSREGYRNALRLPMARFAAMPEIGDDELAAIFGGTALSVFPVRG
jgi:L-fuconolactonase